MRSPDEVRLVLSGREYTGWTGVSIRMAINTLADSFTLSAPYNPDDKALVAALEPYQYQPVKIFLGDDLYHSGRLDALAFSNDAEQGRTMTLSGRSLPGILCDCSVDDCYEIRDLTLAAIARKASKSLGVSVRADFDTPALPLVRASYGQSVFDFLHELAAPHNCLLNSGFDGRLIVSSADSLISAPIRAVLTDTSPSFLSASASFNASERFSLYEIATQFADVPDITGRATDPAIPLYRPCRQAAGETDAADPDTTAARLMSERLASSLAVTVKLSGWRRPDGGLWSERQAISFQAPSVRLLKAARYVISEMELSLDAQAGRVSALSLVPPELYNSALIKSKKAKADLW